VRCHSKRFQGASDPAAAGRHMRKVLIDVDALLKWCRERHCVKGPRLPLGI
jgi:hypothetical protein